MRAGHCTLALEGSQITCSVMCAFYRENHGPRAIPCSYHPLSNTHSMRQETSKTQSSASGTSRASHTKWSSPAHISPRADSSSWGSAEALQLGRSGGLHPRVGGRECLVHPNPSLCHLVTLVPRLGTGGWAAAHVLAQESGQRSAARGMASLPEAAGDQQALGELAQTCITPTTYTLCRGSDLTGLWEGMGT